MNQMIKIDQNNFSQLFLDDEFRNYDLKSSHGKYWNDWN